MRPIIKMFILAGIVLAILNSCSSAPKFSDVTDKEWLLVEIKSETGNTVFDRETLNSDGFSNIFTLNFDDERLSGIGAPNRFTAPYKVDKNQVISVQLIAGTMMAAIREPERLKEQDYFSYLQNTSKWNLTKDGQMELYSKNADGKEVVLVYKQGTTGK